LGHLSQSAILCAGSINLDDGGGTLVLVCDGDLTVEGRGIGHSILIVRGSVRCSGGLRSSVLLAGGSVSFGDRCQVSNCTIRAGGPFSLPRRFPVLNCDIRGNVKDALSLLPVTFFDPSSLGGQVGPAREGAVVTAAAADKPFATAGLAVGDLVVSLDGTMVKDTEGFRRLLRKRFVQGGTAIVEVRRAGKPVKLEVRLL
jgi:hypothetical protein